MQPDKIYKDPVVCTKDPKDYYIYFEYYHCDKWHSRKVRGGINRIEDLIDRAKEAEALCKARLLWLQSGWNPILDPKYEIRTISGENSVQKMSISQALDFAFKNKKLADKSKSNYRGHLNLIKRSVKENGWFYLQISELKRFHVKMIMVKASELGKLSGHGHNKHLATFRAMLTVLMDEYNALEHNPAWKIKKERVAESDKYRSWTPEQKQLVAECLYLNHYRFFIYLQVLYNTGIRPKEVLALRIKDIDLKNNMIRIVPIVEEENSKTLSIRRVPISKHLVPFLRELKLEDYPRDYYVFGSPFPPGKGNTGSQKQPKGIRGEKTGISGSMRSDYFVPSLTRIKRDTVTRLFNRIVRNPVYGLGMDIYMYALKHTGADDKILSGIDLDALRIQYGHKSKLMTEVYAKAVRQIYKYQLVNNAPAWVLVREDADMQNEKAA